MSIACEIRMQISYGAEKISIVKSMFEERQNDLLEFIFKLNEQPIHIDVTRKGKWIKTKVKRYRAPLWFDPMEKIDIDYNSLNNPATITPQ